MENVTMVNPGERKKFTQSRERVEPLLGKVCAEGHRNLLGEESKWLRERYTGAFN